MTRSDLGKYVYEELMIFLRREPANVAYNELAIGKPKISSCMRAGLCTKREVL